VESVITAPAIKFKGSGWYVTDYAGKTALGETPEKSDSSKGEKDGAEKASSDKSEKKDGAKKESSSASKESSSKESAKESKESKPAKKKWVRRNGTIGPWVSGFRAGGLKDTLRPSAAW